MYWLTENAFQPLMLGLLVAMATGAFGYVLNQRKLIAVCVVTLLLTSGIVVTEQLIVTHKEQLEMDINSMAAALSRNDQQTVLNYVDPSYDELINRIRNEMPDIDFRSVTINNLLIHHEPQATTAQLEFIARVAADATRSRYGAEGTGVVSVSLDYELGDDGRWRIVNYDHDRVRPNDFMRGY